MKKSVLAAAIAFVITIMTGLAISLPAQAHTSLRSSDPAKNAKVESLRRVTLEFTESVRFPTVIVRGPDGKRYERGKPVVDGPRVYSDVASPVPPGEYTIAYRVVSADGHPVEGEIPFTVVGSPDDGQEESPAPGASEAAPGASEAASTPAVADQQQTPAQTAGAKATPAEAASEETSPRIPGWLWAVVFGVAGVGIGLLLSLRKKP